MPSPSLATGPAGAPASREFIRATTRLRSCNAALFQSLRIEVKALNRWTLADVKDNQKDGLHTRNIALLPPEFKDIQDALELPRWYRPSDMEEIPEFQFVRALYTPQFDLVFQPDEHGSRASVLAGELVAFYKVLRGFGRDVLNIAGVASSSIKACNFCLHFIQPAFFSLRSKTHEYIMDGSWDFPIFVEAPDLPNAFRKYAPRSDCMVFSSRWKIPFIICEVISDKHEADRPRLLHQAIVLARVGKILLQPGSQRSFFTVALYVDTNLVVTRYLVMQTGTNGDDSVSIHECSFDLRDTEDQINFLRQMFNLASLITSLSSGLDLAKRLDLGAIRLAASGLCSLTSRDSMKTTGQSTMHSITEESSGQGRGLQDDLGIFGAEDVQRIIHEMHCEIEFIPYGHPHLAVVLSKTGDSRKYLKFIAAMDEIPILEYLTGITSPSNHTISPVKFWPVHQGNIISMPVAGGWLTSLKQRNQHLWSVSLQLVEGVAFMHAHGVAHMDLKPHNIIIPPDGGRLSIIDFSVSIHVTSPDALYKGVVGTEGYIAPEVYTGQYQPLKADLWSCGKTLTEFCSGCQPSIDHGVLLAISRQLMNQDPEARPPMSAVLEQMAPARRGTLVVPYPSQYNSPNQGACETAQTWISPAHPVTRSALSIPLGRLVHPVSNPSQPAIGIKVIYTARKGKALRHSGWFDPHYPLTHTPNAELLLRFYEAALRDYQLSTAVALAHYAVRRIIGQEEGVVPGQVQFCPAIFQAVSQVDTELSVATALAR